MRGRAAENERGSATVWVICMLMLVTAATGWAMVWTVAQSARHATERAADSAALAAAAEALHRLATQSGSPPCAAAATAARSAGALLDSCDCVPLDCTVAVQRSPPLIGALVLGPVRATSRAGPVGESGGADEGR